jgi:hypothetical protein
VTVDEARKWLILSSLSVTGGLFVFFLLAPTLGYPLLFSQSLRILEIVSPVFFGYLGSAATFVFRSASQADVVSFRAGVTGYVGLLIRGPLVVFGIAFTALIVAFGVTNSATAPPGSGVSIDQLGAGVSVILGLLAVTTSVAVNYLFGGGNNADSQNRRNHSAADPATSVRPNRNTRRED